MVLGGSGFTLRRVADTLNSTKQSNKHGYTDSDIDFIVIESTTNSSLDSYDALDQYFHDIDAFGYLNRASIFILEPLDRLSFEEYKDVYHRPPPSEGHPVPKRSEIDAYIDNLKHFCAKYASLTYVSTSHFVDARLHAAAYRDKQRLHLKDDMAALFAQSIVCSLECLQGVAIQFDLGPYVCTWSQDKPSVSALNSPSNSINAVEHAESDDEIDTLDVTSTFTEKCTSANHVLYSFVCKS